MYEESKTYQRLTNPFVSFFGQGIAASDHLVIPDFPLVIEEFSFYHLTMADFSTKMFQGCLGFAYSQEYTDENDLKASYDLFDVIKSIHKSYKRMIGLNNINNNQGELIIGDYPKEIKDNMKLYKKCPVTSNQGTHSWYCHLNAVYFDDNKLYTINRNVDFIIGSSVIEVDEDFFVDIMKNYFQYEIDNKICEVVTQRYIELYCEGSKLNKKKLGSISFVFGKWSLKVKIETLFYKEDEKEVLGLITTKKQKEWHIAPVMITDYYIFFDKDDNSIGFYKKMQ